MVHDSASCRGTRRGRSPATRLATGANNGPPVPRARPHPASVSAFSFGEASPETGSQFWRRQPGRAMVSGLASAWRTLVSGFLVRRRRPGRPPGRRRPRVGVRPRPRRPRARETAPRRGPREMGPFARTDTARALEALLAARAGLARLRAAAGATPAGRGGAGGASGSASGSSALAMASMSSAVDRRGRLDRSGGQQLDGAAPRAPLPLSRGRSPPRRRA